MTIAELMVKLGLDSSDFTKGLEDANKLFADKASEIQKSLSGFSGLSTSLTSIGAGMTAGITAPLAALAAASISSAGTFESLQNALTTITKDSAETANQMERLKEVARLPGLGLEEAVQGSIRLQNAGMAAQEAERYLRLFGNAIAAAGGGAADLDAVTMQLMQMSSKSKVVAGDLKPIMERVPQMASIVKEAFGTLDTEQLQKMGVSTQEFLTIVTDNLEKIPMVTGGVKNAFENMGDSAKVALARIGENFIPVIEIISGLVEYFLDKVGDFADWFGDLPAPIQVAAGTLVTFAAGLGPVLASIGLIGSAITSALPVLTSLATFFGTTVAALGGWALAVAGVVAALAALGTWVYQNWEPIKATVSTAWDGISEAWGAFWNGVGDWFSEKWGLVQSAWDTVMTPIVDLAKSAWDGITEAWSAVWNLIGPTVTGAWDGIKGYWDTYIAPLGDYVKYLWSEASDLWNATWSALSTAVSGAVSSIVEWIGKLPGVSKLMNLDDVWKSTKKATEESAALAKASQEEAKKNKAAEEALRKYRDSLEKTQPNQKKSKELTDEQKLAMSALKREIASFRSINKQFAESFKKVNDEAIQKSIDKADEAVISLADFGTKLAEAGTKGKDANVAISPLLTTIGELKTPTDNLRTALEQLGVQSTTSYQAIAIDAQKAYEAVVQSENATDFEKNSALKKTLEAQVAAAKAAGESIPADWGQMIDDLEQKTSTKLPEVAKPWEGFKTNVSTVITNFAQDIGKSLFDGETSWGEKMKGMLTGLGSAVASSFIEPAAKAISDFISGALTKLLSGEGFGGLFNTLTSIGDKITEIFTGSKKVTDAVGGVAGAAGGVGGGIGGAVSSGITGVIGAVGSVVGAVSGIIGNFQNARQETTLNAIEWNTRKSSLHLEDILNKANDTWPSIPDIHSRMWAWTGEGLGVKQFGEWKLTGGNASNVTINADEGAVDILGSLFSDMSVGLRKVSEVLTVTAEFARISFEELKIISDSVIPGMRHVQQNLLELNELMRLSVDTSERGYQLSHELAENLSVQPRNNVQIIVNVDSADSRRIADEIVDNLRLAGVMT